ncbi:hypothetical protein [Psychroserpens luteus]|uniref:Uncharacterized protein n=1 Tax=Psychroserpens luteus TaxID=1434066 RepID=A0ABW5ZR87_9FLAO|nr:hypothetical protein [Psychroserpens luteus]
MRNLLYICLIGLVALSCDDGDVFEVSLEFDQELELCIDINENDNLLYDTKLDPSESLSLLFPISNNIDIFEPTEYNSVDPVGYVKTLTINESSIKFNYRTYNGDPNDLICQFIANPGTEIIEDYSSASGAIAEFTTTFEDDDLDGILSEKEGRGTRADDGTYPDAIDTDGDGLPDYIDEDDDNDSILTKNETPDPDGDGNPSDALNTDLDLEIASAGDILPNYLDNDDDGDGTPTINEDADGSTFLTDDFDESEGINIVPRYLDFNADDSYTAIELGETEYTRTTVVSVVITNSNLGIASIDTIELGTYTFTTIFVYPEEE